MVMLSIQKEGDMLCFTFSLPVVIPVESGKLLIAFGLWYCLLQFWAVKVDVNDMDAVTQVLHPVSTDSLYFFRKRFHLFEKTKTA